VNRYGANDCVTAKCPTLPSRWRASIIGIAFVTGLGSSASACSFGVHLEPFFGAPAATGDAGSPLGPDAASPAFDAAAEPETGALDSAARDATTPQPSLLKLAVGNGYTCGIKPDRTAVCWGSSGSGDLGDGTYYDSSVPVAVQKLSRVVDIAARGSHTCAVLQEGGVACWGWNGYGQLGNDSLATSPIAVLVSGLADATQIAVSNTSSCAVSKAGTVSCWGDNASGDLADNTDQPQRVPKLVASLSAVATVASGGNTFCALHRSGEVSCWGSNSYGQAGRASTTDKIRTPVSVTGFGGAAQAVSVGILHSCALAAGEVYCWGYNGNGQLGDGSISSSPIPSKVPNLTGVVEISAGALHTCARLGNGTTYCWGDNSRGQLGDGSTNGASIPRQVPGLKSQTLSTGGGTCAVRDDGTTACWGANIQGALGRGTRLYSSTPVAPAGDPVFDHISMGPQHACARAAITGVVSCWGKNDFGVLGVPPEISASGTPLTVQGADGLGTSLGQYHSCGLKSGSALCWGFVGFGALGRAGASSHTPMLADFPAANGTITALAASDSATCALQGGSVFCTGSSGSYALGNNGAATALGVPVRAARASGAALTGVTQLAGGGYSSCALTTNEILCWGRNDYGQLNDGTVTDRFGATPMLAFPGQALPTSLAFNSVHSCAAFADGKARCWGYNGRNRVGVGADGIRGASDVQGVSNAKSVTAGAYHSCVLRTDGTVACWGLNEAGELGNGAARGAPDSAVPVNVVGTSTAREIASGGTTSCALLNDGHLRCWGTNGYGELGDGTPMQSSIPSPVVGL
jgi:alpha-tubulin suppressor-like RCC1 family protein